MLEKKQTACSPASSVSRAWVSQTHGRGFEPHVGRYFWLKDTTTYLRKETTEFCWSKYKLQVARLAQLVEHGTLNPRVVGSSPTLGETFG